MKAKIALLGILFSLSAHAQNDQLNLVMTCGLEKPMMDAGMSVTVTKGGFAGLTMVNVRRFFIGHKSLQTYVVSEVAPTPGLLGAPIRYVGEGITLSVNRTTAPLPDGGSIGQLQTQEGSSAPQIENLSCKFN